MASRHIKKEKSSLPVGVRRSKTPPLKLLLRKRYLTKRTFFSLKNGGSYEKGELIKDYLELHLFYTSFSIRYNMYEFITVRSIVKQIPTSSPGRFSRAAPKAREKRPGDEVETNPTYFDSTLIIHLPYRSYLQ